MTGKCLDECINHIVHTVPNLNDVAPPKNEWSVIVLDAIKKGSTLDDDDARTPGSGDSNRSGGSNTTRYLSIAAIVAVMLGIVFGGSVLWRWQQESNVNTGSVEMPSFNSKSSIAPLHVDSEKGDRQSIGIVELKLDDTAIRDENHGAL